MAQFSLSKIFPKKVSDLKFWDKTESIVGVDIGSSSIKVIQLRKEKEQAVLETYGELAAGPYSGVEAGKVVRLPEDKITSMLKDLFKEAGVNAKTAVVSIPLKGSFLTTIKLPRIAGQEMSEMIKFEARKYIPVSLDEVELDWWELPQSSKSREESMSESESEEEPEKEEKEEEKEETAQTQKMADVLLVAIQKDIIQKYRSIVLKAGVKSVVFEIEVFSMARSVLSRQTAPVMIMDLGAATTKISIVDYGILKSTPHFVDKGGHALTDAMARSLNITFERAEEMKYEIGLSQRPEHKEIVGVMEPVLNFIFAEARQAMLDYRRKYNVSVGRVVLAGGGALLKNITEVAVKSLGVEVAMGDPMAKTQYPPFLQEVLKEMGPTFATATGLALRGL